MSENDIAENLWFELCEFELDGQDICERCKNVPDKLYFRGPTDGGEYCCFDCITAENDENVATAVKIDELEREGHTGHCAARMTFGDGECECELKGIIPGPISRMMCGG